MATSSHSDLSVLIRRLQSITHLPDAERRAILALPATVKVLQPRQDIVRDKEHSTQCCLVLDGWAYRHKMLNDGKRQILSLHVPGDMPDLHSLHLPLMDHSLGALTQCRVALVPHDALQGLIERFPALAAALWRDTLIDAAIFREWMVGLGRRAAPARIAHLLCEMYLRLHAVGLADKHRYELPITQVDLGDALGLSNVHVNRVLQELRGKGLISLSGGVLTLHDWPALTRIAEFDPTYPHLQAAAAG